MTRLIKQFSIEDHADSIALYMPGGELFRAANVKDTNFRNLLIGLASTLFDAEGVIKSVADEYDIRTTTLLIEEWESSVGIPDLCFSGTGTIDERRRNVLVKLASLGVQTEQDFIDLAALFGVTVTIIPNINLKFTINVNFSLNISQAFPLPFPISFVGNGAVILECLFNRVKPANCDIIFNQV